MSDLSPEEIINRLRQTIRNGKLGKDYTIKPREKNNLLREQYLISDEKIDEILLALVASDYLGTEDSINNDYSEDVIHKFKKDVSLIPRYSESIERKSVRLYIKLTWTESEYGKMIIISFHKWNDK